MKIEFMRNVLSAIVIISFMIPAVMGIASDANIRAMTQRAEEITLKKNAFVRAALEKERIPYQVDQKGIPVRIHFDNAWHNIQKIDIIPMEEMGTGGGMITGHALFFFTETNIYQIQSALPIRKSNP